MDSDVKAHIVEAARTWHVEHEFSDCRYNIVFIKVKQFSEFGSLTIFSLSKIKSLFKKLPA